MPYPTNNRTPGIAVKCIPVPGVHLSRLTKHTEVLGTGVEFVPNLAGVFDRVLQPYRSLPKTSVGYLPTNYSRYTLVHTLPNAIL